MSTDFFQQQARARSSTGRLVALFVVANLFLVVLVYLLCVGIFDYAMSMAGPEHRLWHPLLFAGVAAALLLVVGGGSALKAVELAGGGKTVALSLGGRQIPGDTHDQQQRRLLNIVEEMALASGTPAPPVYLLADEPGINAFAAGFTPGDAVLAVSQGCLKYLNRDELQGVVAHEFSHILNGDMRLNLRMLALLHGLVALSLLGWVLLEITGRTNVSSSRTDRDKDKDGDGEKLALALLVLGVGLYVLGLIGVFVSNLIKAGVARQREYLADASAVQFTRNPAGIGGALKKIGGLGQAGRSRNARSAEVSHLFLVDPYRTSQFASWTADHPPLEDRIRRIDPSWDGVFPEVEAIGVEQDPSPNRTSAPPAILPGSVPGLPGMLPIIGAALSGVGGTNPASLDQATSLQARLPPALREAAQGPFRARALIYGLLLDTRSPTRAAQLQALEASVSPLDFAEVRRLVPSLTHLSDDLRLPLVDVALPALRQMSPDQHQQFRSALDKLKGVEHPLSLFEYTLDCVLRQHLDAAFSQPRPPRMLYQSLDQLQAHMATILSLIAWEGQPEEEAAHKAFDAGMRVYTGGSGGPHLRPRAACTLRDLDSALRECGAAVPSIRQRVILACTACVMADGKVVLREAELLRAIASTLNCPLPPLPDVTRDAGD